MKRYIKTKAGQIVAYDDGSSELEKPIILNYPGEIAGESDSLEGLFDFVFAGFAVFCPKPKATEDGRNEFDLARIREFADERNITEVYGAIHTRWGFRYAAKLNGTEWEQI